MNKGDLWFETSVWSFISLSFNIQQIRQLRFQPRINYRSWPRLLNWILFDGTISLAFGGLLLLDANFLMQSNSFLEEVLHLPLYSLLFLGNQVYLLSIILERRINRYTYSELMGMNVFFSWRFSQMLNGKVRWNVLRTVDVLVVYDLFKRESFHGV